LASELRGRGVGYKVFKTGGILAFISNAADQSRLSPTVFLDRDGVLNKRIENGYVTQWSEFRFLPRTKPALRSLRNAGFRLLVVSNQAGVAKGKLAENDLIDVTTRSLHELQRAGAALDGVFLCMHHPNENCSCRKPRAGLMRCAAEFFLMTLPETFLVGDSPGDIVAGNAVGSTTIYVGALEDLLHPEERPSFIASDLRDAANWILNNSRTKMSKKKNHGC
jgi:D-glycero-D-manno-heptose 1,7-bisphosphate phosphatase